MTSRMPPYGNSREPEKKGKSAFRSVHSNATRSLVFESLSFVSLPKYNEQISRSRQCNCIFSRSEFELKFYSGLSEINQNWTNNVVIWFKLYICSFSPQIYINLIPIWYVMYIINCYVLLRIVISYALIALSVHSDNNPLRECARIFARRTRSDYYSKRKSQHCETRARNTGGLEKNQPATLRSVIALWPNWSSAALLSPLPRAPFSYAPFSDSRFASVRKRQHPFVAQLALAR